jgi:hypothetical protein
MILFLDFDGVLHPAANAHSSGSDLFCSLHLLEGVLRQVPHVEVVISSSWRECHGLAELREFFAQDLRDRIIDVTPLRFTASKLPREAVGFKRHAECMDWLRRRRAAETRWIAIDDQPWLWAPLCPHLLLIDGSVGLTASDAQELLARLREN